LAQRYGKINKKMQTNVVDKNNLWLTGLYMT